MKKSELIKEAMMSFTEKDGVREALASPFEIEGYVYATESHVAMRVPSDMLDGSYDVSGKGYRVPKANAVFVCDKYAGTVNLKQVQRLIEDEECIGICGVAVRSKYLKMLIEASGILGIEWWKVYVTDGEFPPVCFKNGSIEIIIMPYLSDPRVNVVLGAEPIEEGVDEQSGTEYLKRMKEARERKENERISKVGKNYDNIYSVRLVRYASVYVEAGSEEEAMKIAEEKADPDDDDFGNDWEVDACDTYAMSAEYYMKKIYTAGKAYTYDEYAKRGEDYK